MQNSLGFSPIPYNESNNTIRYDTQLLKFLAEEDYLIGRYLVRIPGYLAIALFHFQQSVEKYLKSYLALNSYQQIPQTHKLEPLLNLCSQYDSFFQDAHLEISCVLLTPFAEVGRYPNHIMQSYSFSFPGDANFFDEFIYKMRNFFTSSANTSDAIQLTCNRQVIEDHDGLLARQLFRLFQTDNPFAELIVGQFFTG